jgi:hypothetical protein
MTVPGVQNTSQTARLLNGAPGFAVGWQEPVYLASPAVGQEWVHKTDGRYYERLITARWTLATSAVVATRFPTLQLTDTNGVVITSVPMAGGVVASTVVVANLINGLTTLSSGTVGNTWGQLPDLLVPPGWTWQAVTSGLDAGDQESGIVLVFQKFPNDAAMITAGG